MRSVLPVTVAAQNIALRDFCENPLFCQASHGRYAAVFFGSVVEIQTRRVYLATWAAIRDFEPIKPFGATIVKTLVSSPRHASRALDAMPFSMTVAAQNDALRDLGFAPSKCKTSHVADGHHLVDQMVKVEAHGVSFRTPRAPPLSFEILHPGKTGGVES
jgi:hypothetical protein